MSSNRAPSCCRVVDTGRSRMFSSSSVLSRRITWDSEKARSLLMEEKVASIAINCALDSSIPHRFMADFKQCSGINNYDYKACEMEVSKFPDKLKLADISGYISVVYKETGGLDIFLEKNEELDEVKVTFLHPAGPSKSSRIQEMPIFLGSQIFATFCLFLLLPLLFHASFILILKNIPDKLLTLILKRIYGFSIILLAYFFKKNWFPGGFKVEGRCLWLHPARTSSFRNQQLACLRPTGLHSVKNKPVINNSSEAKLM
uniref:Uncharacterized protein n=1 Tax=Rhodnius prolixus TaxID=13249 RepID=T1I1K0_RHOPR